MPTNSRPPSLPHDLRSREASSLDPSAQLHPTHQVADVVRVASGNFLEMYDFMIFGYYASDIARAFFPVKSEFASLMLSLATFGAGFLMRPLGALVLGSYMDRQGRRKGLLLTLLLMSFGTLSVACVPGYDTIGLAAPLLVLIGRLLQGFSAGVELGGVSVYLSEIATPGRKGFYVSWQSCSQQVAVVTAAGIGLLVTAFLSKSQMDDWGWRVPLFLGCLIIPFLFWIRNSLRETDTFLTKSHHSTASEILQSLRQNWSVVILGMLMVTMTTVSFYLITAYTPTYAGRVLHLRPKDALIVTLCVGISNFIWLPVMGGLSDRIGRRPLLILFSVLAVITAYPVTLWLVREPSFQRLLGVELWLSFIYASYNGAMVAYLTGLMPLRVRTSGFSLAYSLATALFGGFTPAISTYLIHLTQNDAMPGAWLSGSAVLALISLMVIRSLGLPGEA